MIVNIVIIYHYHFIYYIHDTTSSLLPSVICLFLHRPVQLRHCRALKPHPSPVHVRFGQMCHEAETGHQPREHLRGGKMGKA